MKKEVDMEEELKNSISKRYESTSLCGILDLFNIHIWEVYLLILHKIVKYNALIKKYGNPYSKEKENNKALWIMDYEKACKLNEKNEKFFENI
jgi:hypothetical protein